jgi:hypothetical protein
MEVNVREYRSGNQYRAHKREKTKNTTQYDTQAKTNTAIPQTTGGEEEPNIVFMRTSQNGT